jgi:hypothetical protein
MSSSSMPQHGSDDITTSHQDPGSGDHTDENASIMSLGGLLASSSGSHEGEVDPEDSSSHYSTERKHKSIRKGALRHSPSRGGSAAAAAAATGGRGGGAAGGVKPSQSQRTSSNSSTVTAVVDSIRQRKLSIGSSFSGAATPGGSVSFSSSGAATGGAAPASGNSLHNFSRLPPNLTMTPTLSVDPSSLFDNENQALGSLSWFVLCHRTRICL